MEYFSGNKIELIRCHHIKKYSLRRCKKSTVILKSKIIRKPNEKTKLAKEIKSGKRKIDQTLQNVKVLKGINCIFASSYQSKKN